MSGDSDNYLIFQLPATVSPLESPRPVMIMQGYRYLGAVHNRLSTGGNADDACLSEIGGVLCWQEKNWGELSCQEFLASGFVRRLQAKFKRG
jgi:hypothetical protein